MVWREFEDQRTFLDGICMVRVVIFSDTYWPLQVEFLIINNFFIYSMFQLVYSCCFCAWTDLSVKVQLYFLTMIIPTLQCIIDTFGRWREADHNRLFLQSTPLHQVFFSLSLSFLHSILQHSLRRSHLLSNVLKCVLFAQVSRRHSRPAREVIKVAGKQQLFMQLLKGRRRRPPVSRVVHACCRTLARRC
jgi:hypothetical protein